MHKETHGTSHDISTFVDRARALMAATADVAGEKVSEARQQLAASLESGKHLLEQVKVKAAEGAKSADEAVHAHPYQAVAIAFGLGAIIGCLAARRCTCNGR